MEVKTHTYGISMASDWARTAEREGRQGCRLIVYSRWLECPTYTYGDVRCPAGVSCGSGFRMCYVISLASPRQTRLAGQYDFPVCFRRGESGQPALHQRKSSFNAVDPLSQQPLPASFTCGQLTSPAASRSSHAAGCVAVCRLDARYPLPLPPGQHHPAPHAHHSHRWRYRRSSD